MFRKSPPSVIAAILLYGFLYGLVLIFVYGKHAL